MVPCRYLLTFLVAFQWFISRLLWNLPNITTANNKSGLVQTYAYIKLPTADAWGMLLIRSFFNAFYGHWFWLKFSSLTLGATKNALFVILNLSKAFLIEAFWDSCFVSCNKLKSLLASRISFTYRTIKIYLLSLTLRL